MAVSGFGKGSRGEGEKVKKSKKIVEIERYKKKTNNEENEEVKQKESQKKSGGSKGSPVVTVSTDRHAKCKMNVFITYIQSC